MRDFGIIHARFWDWIVQNKLSDKAVIVAAYLLSNQHGNSLGCYRLPPEYVSADLGHPVNTVLKVYEELDKIGFLKYCAPSKHVFMPKYLKWNPSQNTSHTKGILKCLKPIPKTFSFIDNLLESLKNYLKNIPSDTDLDTLYDTLSTPCATDCRHTDTDTDTDTDIKPPAPPDKKNGKFKPPTQAEVVDYFRLKGYAETAAKKAHEYYETANWCDARGNKVKNWKQKMLSVWFKPENEAKPEPKKEYVDWTKN